MKREAVKIGRKLHLIADAGVVSYGHTPKTACGRVYDLTAFVKEVTYGDPDLCLACRPWFAHV